MTEDEMKARIEALEADNEKLKADKHAALGEKNKANAAAKAAQEAADTAAQEAAEKAGDIEAIKSGLQKKHDAELKKLTDALGKANADLSAYKIDSVINAELVKAGVMPDALDWVARSLKVGVTIENGEAVFEGSKPLLDHIATFKESPAAQLVIAAPQNSGAGSTGSSGNVSGHGFTKENIRTPAKEAEWMALEKTNPTLFKQVAVDTGRSDVL